MTALLVWAPLPADALSVVTSVPNGAPLIGPIAAVGGVPLLGSEGPTGISVLGGLPGLLPKTPLSVNPLSPLIPITAVRPVDVLEKAGPHLSVPPTTGADVPNDGGTARTALESLRLHGGEETAQVIKTEGDGVKTSAEVVFMKSASLEGPSGAGNASVNGAYAKTGFHPLAASHRRKTNLGHRHGLKEIADAPQTDKAAAPVAEDKIAFQLANGMTVELWSKPGHLTANITIAYAVGGRDEAKGQSGFSHLIEHLMFQGTRAIKNWFRMAGTMGAQTNAQTQRDLTLYTQNMPISMLETALQLEADRMTHLDLTPEKVAREIRTVLNEKTRGDSNPYANVAPTLYKLLFAKERNRSNVIGIQADIERATVDNLKPYIAAHYTPGKAHMIIEGGIDLDKTRAWVERHFGAIPKLPVGVVKPDLSETGLSGEARVEVSAGAAPYPLLSFGWQAPKRLTADYHAAGVLAQFLTNRLFNRLVIDEKSALETTLSLPYVERDPSAVTGQITLGPDLTHAAALAAVDEELARIVRGDIDKKELSTAINMMLTQLNSTWDDAPSRAMASALGIGHGEFTNTFNMWKAVSAADLQRVATTFFGKNQRAVVIVKPTEQKAVAESGPVHAHRPSNVEEAATAAEQALLEKLSRTQWPNIRLSAPADFTLPNGLRVIVLEDHRSKDVQARLVFRQGNTASDARTLIETQLAASLLPSRTAEKDERALNDFRLSQGVILQSAYNWDHSLLQGSVSSARASAMLNLMAEMVTRPHAWTSEELSAIWVRVKDYWKASAMNADAVTYRTAVADILGKDDPSAAVPNPEWLDSLTPAKLAELTAGHFAANNAVLVIAGDVDIATMKTDIQKIFGSWKASNMPAVAAAARELQAQDSISLVEQPGTTEALIRLSMISLDAQSMASPDYFPLCVLNAILGGGLASRLTQKLRQSLGIAYSPFAEVTTEPNATMMNIGLYTRNEHTHLALTTLLEEVRLLRDELVGEIEMGAAKNGLVSAFMRTLDHAAGIADWLYGAVAFNHKSLQDWFNYPSKIAAVTPQDIRRLANKLLSPQRLAITAAGDPEILKALQGVRPVVSLTAEGKPRPSS
ncbi:MAG: pitrilysin family protein [Elusimicrobiota bacterium]